MTSVSERAVVVVDPGVRGGTPAVRGVSVFAITDVHAAGGDPTTHWDLTRGDVLVACWYEARHSGTAERKRHWAAWLATVATLLAADVPDYAAIPLPPCREGR